MCIVVESNNYILLLMNTVLLKIAYTLQFNSFVNIFFTNCMLFIPCLECSSPYIWFSLTVMLDNDVIPIYSVSYWLDRVRGSMLPLLHRLQDLQRRQCSMHVVRQRRHSVPCQGPDWSEDDPRFQELHGFQVSSS